MAQPAAPFLSRSTVRVMPFSTPQKFISPPTLAAGATTAFFFEIGSTLSDRNATGAAPPTVPLGTGFFLDASVFSDQAGTLDVLFWVYPVGTVVARSVMPLGAPVVVAASELSLIAGLRIVGLGCRVDYKNTSGAAANVEFFAAVRSV